MIGVIVKEFEKEVAIEFFQLFKTPWEFYQENRRYDVVIVAADILPPIDSKLTIFYNSNPTRFDFEEVLEPKVSNKNSILEYQDISFSIFGQVLTFRKQELTWLTLECSKEPVAIEVEREDKKVIRIGFDLFQEVIFLISFGQPAMNAKIPTLDLHISMIRSLILNSGIPLVEIPPVPAGYDYISCLTHDVDFYRIRNHKFDRSMFGFVYRALISTLIGFIMGRCSWNKVLINWKSVFLLPGVYLGIVNDYWFQLDRYVEIENGLGSTFFFIPFKNKAGKNIPTVKHSKRRAVAYDINDIKTKVQGLAAKGFEVGLHGIDAWQDSKSGRKELERIYQVAGISKIGVRIHWLYFNRHSPELLEDAGFFYDSTFGYNEAVGYRAGTTQVFKPLNTKKLLELPLHIQDIAMFYPDRMNLTENGAWELVDGILKDLKKYGGVLTINWHHRSLGPERLWDKFYVKYIEELKKNRVWFGTAQQVVEWFKKRRSVRFGKINFIDNKLTINLVNNKNKLPPQLILRIHKPQVCESTNSISKENKVNQIDIPFSDEEMIEVSL